MRVVPTPREGHIPKAAGHTPEAVAHILEVGNLTQTASGLKSQNPSLMRHLPQVGANKDCNMVTSQLRWQHMYNMLMFHLFGSLK